MSPGRRRAPHPDAIAHGDPGCQLLVIEEQLAVRTAWRALAQEPGSDTRRRPVAQALDPDRLPSPDRPRAVPPVHEDTVPREVRRSGNLEVEWLSRFLIGHQTAMVREAPSFVERLAGTVAPASGSVPQMTHRRPERVKGR